MTAVHMDFEMPAYFILFYCEIVISEKKNITDKTGMQVTAYVWQNTGKSLSKTLTLSVPIWCGVS